MSVDQPPEKWALRGLRTLIHELREPHGSGVLLDWPESARATGGVCYLVSDGLGTRSTEHGGRKPLLDVLKPSINEVAPAAAVHGFSYSKPGLHYAGYHTNISLKSAYEVFKEYQPSSGTSLTCITFSFAGPTFTLGLAHWLTSMKGAEESVQFVVKALILIQPAFKLSKEVTRAAESIRRQGATWKIRYKFQYQS